MRAVLSFITFILLSFPISSALAADALSSYRGEIVAVRNGAIDIKTEGEMEFKMTSDTRWTLTLNVKGGGVKSEETSTGEIINNTARPFNYKKRSNFLFIRENIDWKFDWANKNLSGKVKKDERQYELNNIIHDPLSFQVAMRQELMAGEKSFIYPYMRYNRPQELAIEVIGQERLRLGNGFVDTLILRQLRPARSNEKKLIWVAPQLDFVPVRFTTYEDDKIKDDVIVEKLWINNQPVSFGN